MPRGLFVNPTDRQLESFRQLRGRQNIPRFKPWLADWHGCEFWSGRHCLLQIPPLSQFIFLLLDGEHGGPHCQSFPVWLWLWRPKFLFQLF